VIGAPNPKHERARLNALLDAIWGYDLSDIAVASPIQCVATLSGWQHETDDDRPGLTDMHKREDRIRSLIERWKDRVRADTGDAAYVDSFYYGGLIIEMMVAELEDALDGE
jgi:hypothetical protein